MDTLHFMVNYLDQDSAEYFTGLNSLLKLDTNGKMIWRSEIRYPAASQTSISNTVMGETGYVYVIGGSTKDLYIQGDTINHPIYPGYYNASFVIQFDKEGTHYKAFFNPFMHFSIDESLV